MSPSRSAPASDHGPSFDAIVVGGGPAGAAAALTLRKRPDVSVLVLEMSGYDAWRIGESLSPGVRPLLDYFDLWDAVRATQPLDAFGSRAAWGAPEPTTLDFLFTVHGAGWSLDRLALDRLLVETARARGAVVETGARFLDCARVDGAWSVRVRAPDGTTRVVRGRVLLDATGRRGRVARRLGAVRLTHDALVGVARVGRLPAGRTMDAMVQVEAIADGWWYTAPIPDGRVSTVLMTDADIARRLDAMRTPRWEAALDATSITRARLDGVVFDAPPRTFSAISSQLRAAAGDGWVAIGDAAASHDPLSSSGIPHALGSGTQGALVAADMLFGEGRAGNAYQQAVARDFAQYRRTHGQVYRSETRWPDAPFWRRRQATVTIDPHARIGAADARVDCAAA
ncbi:MAG: tryptophan 7-halogenase, partial [Acidobacteriota bacterium]